MTLDPTYVAAWLNNACALNMLEKPKEALAILEKGGPSLKALKTHSADGQIALAKGISHALLGDLELADRAFESAMHSGNQRIAVQASFNRNVLYKKPEAILPEHCLNFPETFRSVMQGISLGRISQLPPITLDENGKTFRRSKTGQTHTFSFGDQRGNIVSVIRFNNNQAPRLDLLEMATKLDRSFFYNLVSAPNGFYFKSKEDGLVIQVDNQGKVLEMAKVFIHR